MTQAGLHVIFDSASSDPPRVAELDIVAVHGLNFKSSDDHARKTWTMGDKLWLKDFLPNTLYKPARVMLFEYNSSPAIGATAIKLAGHANNLLQWLKLKRKGDPQKPLVFICHSLGGLIVKEALVTATLDVTYKSIVEATRLLVFFATPHQGGNYASLGDIVAKIVRTSMSKPRNDLLDALKEDSDQAAQRFEQARHLLERCLVVSFYEGDSYGKMGLIVDKKSATLNLPGTREKQIAMHANHSTICKFDSFDSPACELVLGTIADEVDRALAMDIPDLPNVGGQRSESDTRETHPLIPEGSAVTHATLADASINSETSLSSENPWSQKTASAMPSSVSTCGMATHMSDCGEFPSTSVLSTDYKETTDEHDTSKDDIQSIASMDGDITSTADSGPVTAPQRHAAVNYLVEMLTKDKDLTPMYELAFRSMDKYRFKRNHRRLLWSFVEDLRLQRVLIPSQDITISFLGGRRTRDQLSLKIFNSNKPAGDTDRERMNQLTSQEKDHLFALNRFLEYTDAEHLPDLLVEVYGVGDDESEDEDEENNEDQYEDILPKLQATWEFLCVGPAFVRYKDNLRRFLRPTSEPIDPQLANGSSHMQDNQQTEYQSQNQEYDVFLTRSFWLTVMDWCKRRVEYAAGSQLSWWPLSEPEKDLTPGTTRVYSMPFKRNQRFFDDIPTPIADSLFPKLPYVRASTAKPLWAALGREAVYLKGSTLMRHLRRREDQCIQQQGLDSFKKEFSHHQLSEEDATGYPCPTLATQPRQSEKQKAGPILFLSGDIALNESVAITVNVGSDDKTTMQSLQSASQRLPSWRWRRAIGLKFFKFESFHFQTAHNHRRIVLETDKERYPEATHPEYENYVYRPSPWKDGCRLPCLNGQAWFFFNNPDECGTSRQLNDTLPVRRSDTRDSYITAWGIHLERRPSVLIIALPVLLASLLIITATIWFVPLWLENHPGDLQGAMVLTVVAITVLHFVIDMSLGFVRTV
ncbi:uncharacterized protein FTOL_07552 [Fusarium torulosum]|uniref:DUF676 domain-containing protein n=1 Tax=Fusarium torulosum TaxID=33205 RepID=A0AAE8SJH5_9HYPO|nr:uncharacterized protein FTOL_07552 [Fusarium torulosum]